METKPTSRTRVIPKDINERLSRILQDSYTAVQKAIAERQAEQKRESYWFKNQRWCSSYSAQAA